MKIYATYVHGSSDAPAMHGVLSIAGDRGRFESLPQQKRGPKRFFPTAART